MFERKEWGVQGLDATSRVGGPRGRWRLDDLAGYLLGGELTGTGRFSGLTYPVILPHTVSVVVPRVLFAVSCRSPR